MNTEIGRLAIRVEGDNWNAYFAHQGTMKGAVYLGSIKMVFVQDPERKSEFMRLMQNCVADIIEEQTGIRPTWGGPTTAPHSEKTRTA